MKGFIFPCLLVVMSACGDRVNKDHKVPEEDMLHDSSLIVVADSSRIGITDSVAVVADTVHVDAARLIGKWIQPVAGLEKEMQGFQLRKNGTARSINMYTLIYEKWQVTHDTLLLWNHSEGVKDTSAMIDTIIIKELSDTSLVLFPVKAAEGYTERYRRSF
ncbi:lipocalin family protein [Chitinophaga nivalis]|uniref:Lipocalin family protein n=1 Tax=Chitinophaga nivalis TaxID=2991709 RepID=A0ABT3IUW2_9BACT|nr:lipocalin family protein [Chitinophaga nivalis]MCW3462535.1 lipocalin family protein [Chitinophaga nivalis]MCW3487774.1 lipocalin family protein [Chitinophaga nivalis]